MSDNRRPNLDRAYLFRAYAGKDLFAEFRGECTIFPATENTVRHVKARATDGAKLVDSDVTITRIAILVANDAGEFVSVMWRFTNIVMHKGDTLKSTVSTVRVPPWVTGV